MLETIVFNLTEIAERDVLRVDPRPSLQGRYADLISVLVAEVLWRNYPDARQPMAVGTTGVSRGWAVSREELASTNYRGATYIVNCSGVPSEDIISLRDALRGQQPYSADRFAVMFPRITTYPEIPQDLTDEMESKWVILLNDGGHFGRKRLRKYAEFDERFGSSNWALAHVIGDEVISKQKAIQLYEEAYHHHLKTHPEIVEWFVRTASEIYDTDTSNVGSGIDYAVQEGVAEHFQDITIRRVLKRMGRTFNGSRLVQIRSTSVDPEGASLSPGHVPFHRPSVIEPIKISGRYWWDKDSVEEFYRKNCALLVKPEELMLAIDFKTGTDVYFKWKGETYYRASLADLQRLTRITPEKAEEARRDGKVIVFHEPENRQQPYARIVDILR